MTIKTLVQRLRRRILLRQMRRLTQRFRDLKFIYTNVWRLRWQKAYADDVYWHNYGILKNRYDALFRKFRALRLA